MFEKILAPLDGSKLAECALAYLETLSNSCGTSEVILISVTEPVEGKVRFPEAGEAFRMSDDPRLAQSGDSVRVTFGKKERPAMRYLSKIEKGLKARGIPVRSEVLVGNPAEQIVRYARESAADLIVMSSHGRSGPSRWAFGSVADKVFRASCIPVLMVRAPGCLPGI